MKTFAIFYQNVRGLRTKSDEFFASVVDSNYDVIALTETWLSCNHPNASFFPEGFSVYRADREYNENCSRGGGALLAVNDKIVSCRRCDLEAASECVWVELSVPGDRNLLISSSYFAPSVHPHVGYHQIPYSYAW